MLHRSNPGWEEYGLVPAGLWYVGGGRLNRDIADGNGASQLLRKINVDPTQVRYIEQSVNVYCDPVNLCRGALVCATDTDMSLGWTMQVNFSSGSPTNMAVSIAFGGIFATPNFVSNFASGDLIGSRACLTSYSITSANEGTAIFNWVVEPMINGVYLGSYEYQVQRNFCEMYSGVWRFQSSPDIQFDNYNYQSDNRTCPMFSISYPGYTSPGLTTNPAYDWTVNTAEDGEGPISPIVTGSPVEPITYAVTAGNAPSFLILIRQRGFSKRLPGSVWVFRSRQISRLRQPIRVTHHWSPAQR